MNELTLQQQQDNIKVRDKIAENLTAVKEKLQSLKKVKSGYVIVADLTLTNRELDMPDQIDRMNYSIGNRDGNCQVNCSYGLSYHLFPNIENANMVAKQYKVSNGRGPLTWYAVSERDYLNKCIEEFEKDLAFWNNIISGILLSQPLSTTRQPIS